MDPGLEWRSSGIGPWAVTFLDFRKDLPDWVVNGICMFADDTKIWTAVSRVEDQGSLQDDLNKLVDTMWNGRKNGH